MTSILQTWLGSKAFRRPARWEYRDGSGRIIARKQAGEQRSSLMLYNYHIGFPKKLIHRRQHLSLWHFTFVLYLARSLEEIQQLRPPCACSIEKTLINLPSVIPAPAQAAAAIVYKTKVQKRMEDDASHVLTSFQTKTGRLDTEASLQLLCQYEKQFLHVHVTRLLYNHRPLIKVCSCEIQSDSLSGCVMDGNSIIIVSHIDRSICVTFLACLSARDMHLNKWLIHNGRKNVYEMYLKPRMINSKRHGISCYWKSMAILNM